MSNRCECEYVPIGSDKLRQPELDWKVISQVVALIDNWPSYLLQLLPNWKDRREAVFLFCCAEKPREVPHREGWLTIFFDHCLQSIWHSHRTIRTF